MAFVYRPLSRTAPRFLVGKAANGDAQPLCAFLRSDAILALPPEQMRDLLGSVAWLVEQRCQSRKGRQHGALKPANAAAYVAAYLVRLAKAAWCREHGKARFPPHGRFSNNPSNAPSLDRMIKHAIDMVEQQMPELRGKLRAYAVKDFTRHRPRWEVQESAHEWFDLDEVVTALLAP